MPVVGCIPVYHSQHKARCNGGSGGEALGEMTDKLERAWHEHAALMVLLAFCYGKPREEKANPHDKPQSLLKRFALTKVCIGELASAQDWRAKLLLGG